MMSSQLAELRLSIAQLSKEERAILAYDILSSIEEEDEGATEAWQSVVRQRVEDHKQGKAVFITEDELFARLNKGTA
jgi:putative addiction module component (TIGR02574 family)